MEFGDRLRDELAREVARFDRRAVPADGRRTAAVLLAITAGDDGAATFVLTRRVGTLRDHGGQWALPGGRLDPSQLLPFLPADNSEGDGDNDQNRRDDVFGIATPELEELLTAHLLIDFAEDVSQIEYPQKSGRTIPRGLDLGKPLKTALLKVRCFSRAAT